MKANYSEERRMLIGNLNKNKQFSSTTIERMIQSALNRNKVEFNKEALDNMRKASGAERPIILYNIENNTVFGEYSSITDAALSLNCNKKTIYRALKTEKKVLLKRWIVNYK
nr:GIY-YIG endonuclease [Fusarium musae]UTI38514.1 GIY-YIG endonuclease [Fusarium musae]UTI38538.1 GIY-YIG endonuclease [Fusarium musae]UTI38562.1 GIY-YIG endonuclease [Fusarium musae]UTI38586.1 GIY-YIG endonuclease [Fusarium musae]UTI38611.1 GIY-YIG endonuclease [Fusarium musae]